MPNSIPLIRTTSVATFSGNLVLQVQSTPTVTEKFVLEIDQTIPVGSTLPTVFEQNAPTFVPIVTSTGGTVRGDMLRGVVELRKLRKPGFNLVECSPYRFRCRVMYDPVRVIVIDCLPPSGYVPPTPTPTPAQVIEETPVVAEVEVPVQKRRTLNFGNKVTETSVKEQEPISTSPVLL